ncbi:MAG: ATP-binding protein, partial [bacterium]|nr:ATP-binding protein [bacterium]
DRQRIHAEWLTATRTSKPRLLFERKLLSDGLYKYSFGDSWRGDREALKEKTRENALFLSVAVQYDNKTVVPVFDWFKEALTVISDQSEWDMDKLFTMTLCDNYPEAKPDIVKLLKVADLGIEDFDIEQKALTEQPFLQHLPEETRSTLLDPLISNKKMTIKGPYGARVITKHMLIKNDGVAEEVEFDLEKDESAGTKRFFSLAGWLLTIPITGGVIFIDELDACLHPLLTRYIIKLMHRNNREPAQLVFTTHDCGLLDSDLFRRDQIWFTEKNEQGATDVFSLWDYKPRKSENIRKGYLAGRYGAIPFIGELDF